MRNDRDLTGGTFIKNTVPEAAKAIGRCLARMLLLAAFTAAPAAAGPAPAYPGLKNYMEFRYHAVIIGVDIPPDKNGSGSTCHVPFAEELAGALKGWKCFRPGSITVLTGAAAGKARIKQALAGLRLGSGDVLLVYYGGHGDWAGLAAAGGERISPDEMFSYMRGSGAGFMELLVSSCYSGLFACPEEEYGDPPRHSFAVVTSAKENGSVTFGEVGFGPYLLKLLGSKAGSTRAAITAGEFGAFIRSQNGLWKKRGKTRLDDGRRYGPADAVLFWK